MKTLAILISICALAAAGCHSSPKKKPSAATQPMGIQTAVVDPQLSGEPQLAPKPVGTGDMESVYRLPKLRKIYLEPYTDENGNAYGPQVKYVVVEPGGWNTDALRTPARAYIPPQLADGPLQPGAMTVRNMGEDVRPQEVKNVRELYNLDSIVVTGFFERSQEPLVREMAAKQEKPMVPYLDDSLGWILIPEAALQADLHAN